MKIWDKRWKSFALKFYVKHFIVLLVNYFQALKSWCVNGKFIKQTTFSSLKRHSENYVYTIHQR